MSYRQSEVPSDRDSECQKVQNVFQSLERIPVVVYVAERKGVLQLAVANNKLVYMITTMVMGIANNINLRQSSSLI